MDAREYTEFVIAKHIFTNISVAVSASILALNLEFDWTLVSVSNSTSSGFDLMSIFGSDFSVTMNIVSYSFTYISSNTTSSTITTTATTASLSSTTTTIIASRLPLPQNSSLLWFINLFFFCFSSRMIYYCGCRSCIPPCINRFRSWWGSTWSYWLKWMEIMMETGGRLFHASAWSVSFRHSFPTLRENHWEEKVREPTNYA